MRLSVPYRFSVEARGLSEEMIGDCPMPGIDFEPALRCAHLAAIRQGSTPVSSRLPAARIELVDCPERGAPYVSGVQITLVAGDPAGGGVEPLILPLSFFEGEILRGSSQLVEQGLIQAGEQFLFRLCAFPQEQVPPAEAEFSLEAQPDELILWQADLPAVVERRGPPQAADEVPVLVAQRVLDESVELAAAAGELETGGLLLGRLCRDGATQELFVQVSALVAATRAVGTSASLHFGPEAFADLEQVLALRDQGECLVGWFHSHPQFCRNCPDSRRRHCVYNRAFFSQADRDVHRALFPQAWSVALLISDLGTGVPAIDLFSWREGVIHSRGFAVPDAPLTHHQPGPACTGQGERV
jgi:proteasome lid subunit RPN8/RPN11